MQMSSLRATSLLALALLIGSQLIGHASAATSSGNGGIPGTCYNQATPAPGPNSGDLTYPICTNGAISGPTPIAYPTNAGGILLVAPTALPTLSVVVTNPTAFPTPQPLATSAGNLLNVSVTGTNAVTQVTSPWVVSTPPPDNRNSAGGVQAIACDKSVVVNVSTATTTALVTVSGSTAVYVCAYDISLHAGTNPAFQFEQGTGSACASSPVVLTGTFGGANASSNQDFKNGSGVGQLFTAAASNGLCLVSTGTTPNLQGVVTYAQF